MLLIMQHFLICWKKQLINSRISKFTVLNTWWYLLNIRASFTTKGPDKADLVSRRHDYPSGRCPPTQGSWDVALRWDGKVPDMCYQSNGTSLFVLLADTFSVDDDFLTNWKFLVFLIRWWIKTRWKGRGLNNSSDKLYTHHDRLVIPCLTRDLCILLLTEYHIMLAIKLVKPIGNFEKRF